MNQTNEMPETKRKLVDAGVALMRKQGFNATTVDDICSAAGVTKGSFFHYFKTKQEVAEAVLTSFREGKIRDYANAPFRKLTDPLDRIFGRLDFAIASVGDGTGLTKGCLIGVFAQELSFTNPELRGACQAAFLSTAGDLEKDLTEAKSLHAPKADFDPKKVSLFYVSMIQGGLLMAKAGENNAVLLDNIEQFRGYVKGLFDVASQQRPATTAWTSTSNS
ncbi:MAG TPA: TetR/AcrR family transcriptional regulator [Candidatus Acidoferrales bacterium]|nr:TetR/AcrR family transcriptional regulator [Candidatus Acidoferrales bacterium]